MSLNRRLSECSMLLSGCDHDEPCLTLLVSQDSCFCRNFNDLDVSVKPKVVSTIETGVTELLGEIHEAGALKVSICDDHLDRQTY